MAHSTSPTSRIRRLDIARIPSSAAPGKRVTQEMRSPAAPRRAPRWRHLAGRMVGLFRRRLRQVCAVCLAVASTSVPAGMPDKSEGTAQLKEQRALDQRTAEVIEDARVAHIVQRYRRPPEQARRVVQATERVATRHGLPPALLLAIVETESSFNAAARSSYGALGLMQVVPRFHPKVVAAVGGVHRLDEAEPNLEAGARILATYVEQSGSLPKALKRYSGGATAYAEKVAARQQQLERLAIQATRQLDTLRVSGLTTREFPG